MLCFVTSKMIVALSITLNFLFVCRFEEMEKNDFISNTPISKRRTRKAILNTTSGKEKDGVLRGPAERSLRHCLA